MNAATLPAGVIDGHAHIASSRFVPRAFLEGIAENMAVQSNLTSVPLTGPRIMERMLGIYSDHDGEVQIRQMDALGVEKSVVLIPDFSFAMPGAGPTIAEIYAAHAEILRRHPARFCMFGGVDPRWGADGLQLFVKGIEHYGFRGLKLYPPCGYRADDPALTPFYEVCQAYRLPVLVHIGPTSPTLSFAEAHPMTIDAPARRFADVPFILAHGGVNYVEECVQLCGYRPNVYLDLSGAQPLVQAGAATGSLARVLAGSIGHKIIFGTDWPINQHIKMNRALLDVVAGLGGRVAGLIAGGNMRRLRSFPEQQARFITRDSTVQLSFGALHDRVMAGAAALAEMGVAQGSTVALVAGNSWQTVAADLVLLALQCTTVHFVADGADLAAWIESGRLDYLISQTFEDTMAGSAAGTLFGLFVHPCINTVHGTAALAGVPAVIFSSGTAGRIKKIRVNGAGIIPSAEAFFRKIEPLPGDEMLIFLTLSNYQQKLLIYGCILFGIGFCLTDSANVLGVLKRGGITLFLAPPVFYETAWKMVRLAAKPEGVGAALRGYFGGGMRMMWSGMAPIAPEILAGYQSAGTPLLEAYGMTEYGPIAMNTQAANRVGSVGRPVTPGSVEIAPDGEVILRSATPLTTGYLDEPAAAEREVYTDGDIATGDIGRVDADGFLFLLGRKKELIVTSAGVKIHPTSVEQLFAGIANVNHVVLLGDKRPHLGLLVMVQTPMDETLREIEALVEQANAGPCQAAPIRHLRLVEGAFTPGNQMLTRNFKLARGRIAEAYEAMLFTGAPVNRQPVA